MTTECRRWLPLLHDWFEGIADEETKVLAQAHLNSCLNCQQVINGWRLVADHIASALEMKPPSDFDDKLRQSLMIYRPKSSSCRDLTVSWLSITAVTSIAFTWFSSSPWAMIWFLSNRLIQSVLPTQWLLDIWDKTFHRL